MLQVNLQLIADTLSGAIIKLSAAQEKGQPTRDRSWLIILMKKCEIDTETGTNQREKNKDNQSRIKAFPSSPRWRW